MVYLCAPRHSDSLRKEEGDMVIVLFASSEPGAVGAQHSTYAKSSDSQQ